MRRSRNAALPLSSSCSACSHVTPSSNGTWTGPNGLAHNGLFNPAISTPGNYVYRVTGTPPCAAATATVSVFVNQAPNAGISGDTSVCSTAASVPLISALGGIPMTSGTWRNPSNQPHSGILLPGSDPSGDYTYTVPGVPPCPDNATAIVSVDIEAAPNAGCNRTLILCSDAPAFAMTDSLCGTPTQGGIWRNSMGRL